MSSTTRISKRSSIRHEDPAESPLIPRVLRAALLNQLAEPSRLRAEIARSGDEGEQPDHESERHPPLPEVVSPARLVQEDEAEDHQDQRRGNQDAGPVPLDLPGEVRQPVGAGQPGADDEDLNRRVADPHHREEDVEGEQPLVGVAADY
jgi:hypothetical protein